MNKAQCTDYIYASEFTDGFQNSLAFCLCYCNLHSFTIVSSVIASVPGCFAPAAVVLAVLRDVVNQDLMLVS